MKSRQFQSITEEQWKSGLLRHRCALCSHDYGDPVHCVSHWPLVLIIDDGFRPQSAPLVLEVVGKLDDLSCQTMLVLRALAAEGNLGRERWN